MQSITLKPLIHNGTENIAICFNSNTKLNQQIKKTPGIRWSHSNKCWYLPLSKENHAAITNAAGSTATIDNSLLKPYLQKRKQVLAAQARQQQICQPATMPQAIVQHPAEKKTTHPMATPAWNIGAENLTALQQFTTQLKLKAYSPSTIRTYCNELMQLLQLLKNKPAHSLLPADIKRYMLYTITKECISENTAHSRLNALKFYFEQVLKREKFFFEIPRPKKKHLLPKVFSQNEIAGILKSVTNLKHKCMLMLAYGAGLRVSEITTLKTTDINSQRMTIFIQAAKGKKDRLVSLSPVLLVMLREYAIKYKPNKKGWLFEGEKKDTAYSVRSLQEVLQAAKQKAGILRPGGMHSLRHSFATHLVERGTDVTMIQKLLGHNDIKTTLIYLHTSNKDLLKIISPLDDLKL